MPPLLQDRQKGVRVAGVQPGGVGAKAGLQPGDLIETVNGQRVLHPVSLVVLVNQVKAGDSCSIGIVRAGKSQTLTATGLQPLPPEELSRMPFALR